MCQAQVSGPHFNHKWAVALSHFLLSLVFFSSGRSEHSRSSHWGWKIQKGFFGGHLCGFSPVVKHLETQGHLEKIISSRCSIAWLLLLPIPPCGGRLREHTVYGLDALATERLFSLICPDKFPFHLWATATFPESQPTSTNLTVSITPPFDTSAAASATQPPPALGLNNGQAKGTQNWPWSWVPEIEAFPRQENLWLYQGSYLLVPMVGQHERDSTRWASLTKTSLGCAFVGRNTFSGPEHWKLIKRRKSKMCISKNCHTWFPLNEGTF